MFSLLYVLQSAVYTGIERNVNTLNYMLYALYRSMIYIRMHESSKLFWMFCNLKHYTSTCISKDLKRSAVIVISTPSRYAKILSVFYYTQYNIKRFYGFACSRPSKINSCLNLELGCKWNTKCFMRFSVSWILFFMEKSLFRNKL